MNIENNSIEEKTPSLGKNAIYKIILNLCNIIIPVLVGPYILRIIDRELYDAFNVIFADFQLFLIIGAFGIYGYGVREASKIRNNKEKLSKFFSEMFLISVFANIISAALFVGYAFLVFNESLKLIICGCLLIQIFGNVFNFEWMNEAKEDYFFIAIKSLIVRVLYMLAVFLLIKQSNDIVWYAILLSLSFAFNTIISFLFIKRKNYFTFKDINLKMHLKTLFVFFIIANVALLYTQIDKILLGKLVNDAEVTAYQIPHFISGLIYGLLIPIVTVSIPRISNMMKFDAKQNVFDFYKKILIIFLFLFIPATIGEFFLAKEIITLYGGEKYLDCIPCLAFFSITQFFGAGCYIFGDALLVLCNRERILLKINFFGGILNIIIDFIFYFSGNFNAITAIIALGISYIVMNIILIKYVKLYFIENNIKFNFPIFKVCKYFITSIFFIVIIYLISLLNVPLIISTILSIVLCILFYLLIMILTKEEIVMDFLNKFIKKLKN